MRALAEFIMRGRLSAAAVALFGNFLPLISPAAVGLVSLRKGPREGLLVLFWAALPVVLLIGSGLILELVTSVAVLLILWLCADQLRRTSVWSGTILLATALSGLTGVVLNVSLPEGAVLEQISLSLERLTGEPSAALEMERSQVLSLISVMLMVSSLASLFLARWWQAALYNPGGFQQEFHQLRFSLKGGVVLVVGVLVCTVLDGQFAHWVNLLAMPLLISGIALVHWLVKKRGSGPQVLVLFYIGLIVLSPLFVPMLVVIGFTDSLVDLRNRLSAGAN